jgi:16S rRNA (guanine527-N7)-methyltransferase
VLGARVQFPSQRFARPSGARYKPLVHALPAELALPLIDRVASAFSRELAGSERAALHAYAELVARWNRKVNLTAAATPEALLEVLLADAFVLASEGFVPDASRVLDVGSGAGAPIVPLLLLRADVSTLCVEPLGKRATFLRTASARLGLLSRMRVHEAKLDPAVPVPLGESFDVACSRATFEPALWLKLALSIAPRALVLLAGAAPPPAPAGARLQHEASYSLPFSGAPRRACVYLRE